MSDLRFTDEATNSRRPVQKAPGGLIGLVIRLGIVKTPAAANKLFLVFIVIGLLVSFYLLTTSLTPPTLPPNPLPS